MLPLPSQPTNAIPSLPYTSSDICPMQPRYFGQTAPLTAFSCGKQVPDVALPHYKDAKMQHTQSRPLAPPGVTTAVAPKAVPAPTNEVFPASPTQCSGKQRFPKTKQDVILSRHDSVISRLQLSLYSWTQYHKEISKSRVDIQTL